MTEEDRERDYVESWELSAADRVTGDDAETEVTLTYHHPDRGEWEGPVVYTRTVRVADLPKILQAIDDAEV